MDSIKDYTHMINDVIEGIDYNKRQVMGIIVGIDSRPTIPTSSSTKLPESIWARVKTSSVEPLRYTYIDLRNSIWSHVPDTKKE